MSEPADIVLVLPLPPSANRMKNRNAKTGIHYRTKPYEAWLRAVQWTASLQRAGDRISKHYAIRAVVPASRMDLGNYEKPLQDGLKEAGVIKDDRYCRRIVMERDDTRPRDTMLVELWALSEPLKVKRSKALRMAVPVAPL